MSDTPEQGTPLSTDNQLANTADSVISAGAEIGGQTLEKAAEAAEPVLSVPVIKQLFEAAVNWLLGLASRTGQILVTFGITRTQGNAENSSLLSAENEVQAAIQSGDPNAISKAEQDFQRAQSEAVNTDGSAQPR